MEAAAAKLMDFSQPMDVALLDQVVTTAFDASHPQVRGLRRRRRRKLGVVCPGVQPPKIRYLLHFSLITHSSTTNRRFEGSTYYLGCWCEGYQRWEVETRERERGGWVLPCPSDALAYPSLVYGAGVVLSCRASSSPMLS